MNNTHHALIANELDITDQQVVAVAGLLAENATIPFIARYRKEASGSLDEVQITHIRDRLNQLQELDTRRSAILRSLEKNGHLNPSLQTRIDAAETMAQLEDIYLPYRPKRRTRAMIAREKGLAPLAESLMVQNGLDPARAAAAYIDPQNGTPDVETALAGARDIIAEQVSEDRDARRQMRHLFRSDGILTSTVVAANADKGTKYRDYFDWQEPVAKAPSHRVLAMRRGEREDILDLTITPDEDQATALLLSQFVRGEKEDSAQVEIAVRDAYRRLLRPAMETESRVDAKTRADGEAIAVFAANLRQLLLSPPLGAKRVMGIDPGFRSGCKRICLDRQGQLLHHETVYLHRGPEADNKAGTRIEAWCRKFKIEAIAVGNGTAGRETEAFLRKLQLPETTAVTMVDESGASVYSASPVAREEFPDLDLTVRGAVSIARRLMDPLAELVKIDPKSIGVGQYQHDVDQTALRQTLDDVVISCVNQVGVDVNRASAQLLTYVSGLGPALARNIVKHRNANGPFRNRKELQNVPRLGPKAFEQCAGFLRIVDGDNRLDASAVHPESYPIVDAMARDLGCSADELMVDAALRAKIDPARYVKDTVGMPTLVDILAELAKPGRDPRKSFQSFAYDSRVERIEDLRSGMQLPGIVTNVTAFGAFVDVGVHQDGLVHISQLSDRFVKHPADVVKVRQTVRVRVLDVDLARGRIALSMRSEPADVPRKRHPQRAARRSPKKRKTSQRPFNNPFGDAFKAVKK